MTLPDRRTVGPVARLVPAVLGAVGLAIVAWIVLAVVDPAAAGDPPSWLVGLALLPAAALVVVGAAVVIDPRPLSVRRALAGAALLWLVLLAAMVLVRALHGTFDWILVGALVLAAVDGGALLALAATTDDVTAESLPGPLGRLAATILFSAAILVASATLVLAATAIVWAADVVRAGAASPRLPWAAFLLILVLPVVAFSIAALDGRRARRGSFRAQQAANRRNSLLLFVALVGVVAATAEVITAALTFSATPALVAAGIAVIVGLAAAFGADRFGADVILGTASAHAVGPREERVLTDVVAEVALVASIPAPRVYVIEDGSLNAFATGRDPAHASLAVTRGLLTRLDREELQGVIGHEMGHIRNLDTRYALYVAVLVGLVALVTDGFLQVIVEAWKQGGFIWTGGDDAKEAAAAFVSGILVGIFLLVVALVLRVAAPLFSMLVQAAVSREREYLADATSVELTRNPMGLERALASIADDRDVLNGANRGTQHLWFRNPVKAGSDGGLGILATHPTIGARIERLRIMRGAPGPMKAIAGGDELR